MTGEITQQNNLIVIKFLIDCKIFNIYKSDSKKGFEMYFWSSL